MLPSSLFPPHAGRRISAIEAVVTNSLRYVFLASPTQGYGCVRADGCWVAVLCEGLCSAHVCLFLRLLRTLWVHLCSTHVTKARRWQVVGGLAGPAQPHLTRSHLTHTHSLTHQHVFTHTHKLPRSLTHSLTLTQFLLHRCVRRGPGRPLAVLPLKTQPYGGAPLLGLPRVLNWPARLRRLCRRHRGPRDSRGAAGQ